MMQAYKMLIYLAVWKRPEITEICFMGIDRLRKSGLFPIEAFAVISEESMIPLCEKYDIGYCMHENLPLGKKLNFGLAEAYKKEWDYFIQVGSDDLLTNEYLEVIKENLKWDLLTIDNFAYLNSEDMECRMYNNKSTFGIGRVIKRSAIDKVGTSIWNERLNHGLDNSSTFFLARRGVLGKRIASDRPLAIDIKSEVNIWPFNYLNGVPYDFDELAKGLSEQEVTAIKALQCVTA